MTTHYLGSKGPRPIAEMATPHLWNALSKLQGSEPHRREEIAALQAELNTRPDGGQIVQGRR